MENGQNRTCGHWPRGNSFFCSVQLIVETRLVTAGYFNRRFPKGHGGGPGLAGDIFFQPRFDLR
jgi:hypothetical protein